MNEITIRFDFKENTLYELGYLSNDIYQLIVFCELLENKKIEELDKYFYSDKKFSLSRHSKALREYRNKAKIKDIGNGSIEIVISGLTLLATIIVPFVIVNVQSKLNNQNQNYVFEINTSDPVVNNLINNFQRGSFGQGAKDLQWVLNHLSSLGYTIDTDGPDVFKIYNVLDKYEKRMFRLVKK